MKSMLTRSLVLLATLFFGISLTAQDAPTLQQGNIVIKTTDKDGNVLINKFRLSDGQDVESVMEKLNMDEVESLEVRIESNEGTNFKFRTNDEEHILALKENATELTERLERKEQHLQQLHWQMQQHQGEKKALLGVYPENAPNGEGVLVTGIVANSGAQKAGLQKDDILLTINGQRTANNSELRQVLSQFKPNDVVTVSYLRNGATLQTQATLGEKESHGNYYKERDPCKVFIGVSISGRGSEGGVRVSGIIPGTAAEKHKVQQGDVILAMDDVAVNSFNELLNERNKHEAGDLFTLTIQRDGQTMDLDAQFLPCERAEE
ncbi:MAG: PDZ domain-containing protein, partial [Phaeodactylibacter sp.]|nr:PDZ domain-containing protein [Phaeodactylibacter sp.]